MSLKLVRSLAASPPGAPADSQTVFELPVRVYWEDTDAGGIVFYANDLKFFERARTEWLRTLGIQQQSLRDDTGGIFVVSEVSLRYHQPARLDDELRITARVQSPGRASLIFAQQAWPVGGTQNESPTLLCEGTVRVGWVDATTMRPARMPVAILEVLK